ncbi:MAG: hypothetical protein P4M11_07940 [Candidatus Pacebacteria bacterium]|nr:hypothetical protein [Candidatus Paceibacterota bacterium]
MDLKQRIKLLDSLQSLGVERKLPEKKVAALVTFLAKLPEDQRECILEYVGEGSEFDQFDRLERFAELAAMPPVLQAEQLQAIGINMMVEPHSRIDDFVESARTKAVNGFEGVIEGVARKAANEDFGDLIWGSFIKRFKKWMA